MEKISLERLPLCIAIAFILISPFENIAKIEGFYYIVFTMTLFLCLLFRKRIRKDETLFLPAYLVWLWLSTFWSPANNTDNALFNYCVVLFFLYLQLQFDYDSNDYKKLKIAFILQGLLLVLLCINFGTFRDARFWLGGITSDVDPNYLSGWFIYPICFSAEMLLSKNTKFIWKVLLVVEVLLSLYFIMHTASRAGIVANVLCFILAILFSIKDTILRHPIKALVLVFVTIVVMTALFWNIPSYTLHRLMNTASMGERGLIWKELLNVMDYYFYPYIIGMGFGSVSEINSFRMAAHNTFLDIFFAEGIIGLYLILSFICLGIKRNIYEKPYLIIGTFAMFVLLCTLSAFTTRFFMLCLFMLGAKCDAIPKTFENNIMITNKKMEYERK